MYGILIFLSMAKQVTLKKKLVFRLIIIWRTNLWIVMEQPLALRMERRLTPNRRPPLMLTGKQICLWLIDDSLLHLIAPSDLSALGEPATQPHLQAFPEYHNWWEISKLQRQVVLSGIFASYSLNPGNWLMKNWLKFRYNLYKTKFTLKKVFLQNKPMKWS